MATQEEKYGVIRKPQRQSLLNMAKTYWLNLSPEEKTVATISTLFPYGSGSKLARPMVKLGEKATETVAPTVKKLFEANVPHILDPITGKAVTKFRVNPKGLHAWEQEIPIATRNIREVTKTSGGMSKIQSGEWVGGIEKQRNSGYLVEGYNPKEDIWHWIDTEDTMNAAIKSAERWNKAIAAKRKELFGGKIARIYSK